MVGVKGYIIEKLKIYLEFVVSAVILVKAVRIENSTLRMVVILTILAMQIRTINSNEVD